LYFPIETTLNLLLFYAVLMSYLRMAMLEVLGHDDLLGAEHVILTNVGGTWAFPVNRPTQLTLCMPGYAWLRAVIFLYFMCMMSKL
jgi:hypothetical protein